MSRRLFVAIDLQADARADMATAVAALRTRLRQQHLDDAFRWVAIANLHLTLRFLGNVPDTEAARVIDAMREPLGVASIPILFGGLGTFPPRGRPRVLHVAIAEGVEDLRALRDAVDARLAPVCRWEPETRPFAPHLTLARTRDTAKFNPVEFSRLIDDAAWSPARFTASEVTLFSSRTLPAGPEYTVEARAALRSQG